MIHPDRLTPFGKVAIFVGGCVIVAITTLDIHRSIRNNEQPPSQEQVAAFEQHIDEVRQNEALRGLSAFENPDIARKDRSRRAGRMMQVVGLISDTHGVLLPEAIKGLSAATGTIIHAGDIGEPRYKTRLKASRLVEELERGTGSRVAAVIGNVDESCPETKSLFPAYRTLTLLGRKFLSMHICGFPPHVESHAAAVINAEQPDVVVFGHSHVPGAQLHDGILYINPGSAGPVRFRLPQSIACMILDEDYLIRFERLRIPKHDSFKLPSDLRIVYDTQVGHFVERKGE